MKIYNKIVTIMITILVSGQLALAGTTSNTYPWDGFLSKVADDLSSNTVLAIGIIAIVICGLTITFGDLQGGGKIAIRIGLGLSIALTATSIMGKLFGRGALI